MFTQPPPLPSVLAQRNIFRQFARASWISPLLGVIVNILAIGTRTTIPGDGHGLISGLIGGLLCLAGFLFGLIALCGIPKYGIKGILIESVIGLTITGLMFVFATIGFIGFKERLARRQQDMAQEQRANAQVVQEGENAFLDYPGWLGKAQVSGGMIIAASINELSQGSQDLNSHFSKRFSLVNLAVNNTSGTGDLVVDPYSIKIVNADGSSQSCQSFDEVVSSVSIDRQGFIAHYSGLISVAPGQQLTDRSSFFASGTDYSKAVAMNALVNGQEVTISGQFFTPEQKKELFERGKQMQK